MEHLRELDDVAYVRFASVYRNFREAKDFRAALDELSGDDEAKPRQARDRAQMSDQPSSSRPRRQRTTRASWRWRLRSAGAGSATPGPIRRSAR